ncbi:hypothetical protein OROGR_030465 [Orobanche gracilis]
MMSGNPNYWSINGSMHSQSHQLSNSVQFVYGNNSSSVTSDSTTTPIQDFPVRSWSQLLLGGLANSEDERFGANLFHEQKKLPNWEEDQVLDLNSLSSSCQVLNYVNNNNNNKINNDQFHYMANNRSWPGHHHQVIPVSSPTSCVTTLSNNFFNFSGKEEAVVATAAAKQGNNHQHNQEHSTEVYKNKNINNRGEGRLSMCNITSTGGVTKKARVQQSSAQPALKVRKEKLGDRITALHQLVSPFGKTDTASVLSEAIGYIRFLQGQIEALSSPYMRDASVNSAGHHHHHSVQESNCLFPEEAADQVRSPKKRDKGLET